MPQSREEVFTSTFIRRTLVLGETWRQLQAIKRARNRPPYFEARLDRLTSQFPAPRQRAPEAY
jgi:hypothetical protein